MKNDPIQPVPKHHRPRKLGWFAKPRLVRPGDKLDSGATIVSVTMSEGKCFPNCFYNHVRAFVRLLHFIGNLLNRYGLRRAHDYVFDFELKVTGWYFDVIAHKYKKLEQPKKGRGFNPRKF
jgi:hypothetical protein